MIYPNPATETFNAELITDEESQEIINQFNGKNEKLTITIYNIMGKEVLQTFSNKTKSDINIRHLKPGIYNVFLQYGNYSSKKTLKIER